MSDRLAVARAAVLDIYRAGVAAVAGRGAVARALTEDAAGLGDGCDLIAIGKASVAMAEGARDVLGDAIGRGLVITKHGYASNHTLDARYRILEAEHPVPGPRSLAAGADLLDFCAGLAPGRPVLCLISGGASSLVEALPPGMCLAELRRLNQLLLASGLDILRMNALRKAVSRLKAGRLGVRLCGHPVEGLLISDVPGDDPAAVGSGLLVASASVPVTEVPIEVEQLLAAVELPPRPDADALKHVRIRIVAGQTQARAAAASRARALGFAVTVHPDLLEGEASAVGARLVDQLRQSPPGVQVWGGEPVVHLPSTPGQGGRAQHLALAAARALEGVSDVLLLAAGTDGSDGPTDDAGAVVDGETCARGRRHGLDPSDALAGFDAGRFLAASGDLLRTGPTGTNVMDLVIGLRLAASEARP